MKMSDIQRAHRKVDRWLKNDKHKPMICPIEGDSGWGPVTSCSFSESRQTPSLQIHYTIDGHNGELSIDSGDGDVLAITDDRIEFQADGEPGVITINEEIIEQFDEMAEDEDDAKLFF